MAKTYSDIVDAMIKAEERGLGSESVVLSDESFDTFLTDGEFTDEDEERQKESIGTMWSLPVKKGDDDYLVTESGDTIPL